ncbi:ecotin family protein [Campylobacter sputorum]|uniref:ecotin family protein n=1 Tax=Campylobacter sputorum TaxID=206 RepID=UPI000B7903A3|nr:ecotin family protein [Campylobacter sputorum]ASM36774.1 putative serine protease inhibitor, Ecotin family [Campylobacter sputorum bv. faecalis CCUG 20703]
MKILLIFSIFLTTLFGDIFPDPKDGQKKEILKLDSQKEYLVKAKFDKNLNVDCNHHCFTDLNLDKKTLIGYDYYELSGNTDMAYGNVKKTTKFVEFDSNLILPYNSNLEKIFIFQKILV